MRQEALSRNPSPSNTQVSLSLCHNESFVLGLTKVSCGSFEMEFVKILLGMSSLGEMPPSLAMVVRNISQGQYFGDVWMERVERDGRMTKRGDESSWLRRRKGLLFILTD